MPAHEIGEIYANASETFTFSFVQRLGDDTLTGTPTITASPTSGITLSNKVVTSAAEEIDGETIPIGQAVQFKAAPTSAGQEYTITVSCATTAGDTIVDTCKLVVL